MDNNKKHSVNSPSRNSSDYQSRLLEQQRLLERLNNNRQGDSPPPVKSGQKSPGVIAAIVIGALIYAAVIVGIVFGVVHFMNNKNDSDSQTKEKTSITQTTAVNSESEATTKKSPHAILKFSAKNGTPPSETTSVSEIYNGNVLLVDLEDYSDYLISQGYSRDKKEEEESKNDYVYIRAHKGASDGEFVYITYDSFIAIIRYGDECKFKKGGGSKKSAAKPDISGAATLYSETCPTCKGSAYVECPSCDGTGKRTASENTPDYGLGSSSYDFEYKCIRCNGKGSVMCPGCLGTGKVYKNKK